MFHKLSPLSHLDIGTSSAGAQGPGHLVTASLAHMLHLTICCLLGHISGDTRGLSHCHTLLLLAILILDVGLLFTTLLPVGGVAGLLSHVLGLVGEDNVAFLFVDFLTNPEGEG